MDCITELNTPKRRLHILESRALFDFSTSRLGCQTTHSNADVAANSDLLVLAVKPNVVGRALAEVTPAMSDAGVIVSIAAGVTLRQLQDLMRQESKVGWSSIHAKSEIPNRASGSLIKVLSKFSTSFVRW